MKKTLIKLTENDLCRIVKNCINEVLLTEDRASKSRKQTENIIASLFQNKFGDKLYDIATDEHGKPILTQKGDKRPSVSRVISQ